MKNVILSADAECYVYAVPDAVADHLDEYCLEFCTKWLRKSPQAGKYRRGGVYCYNEADFIDYLNRHVFSDEPSQCVENLGMVNPSNLAEPYRSYPRFNF